MYRYGPSGSGSRRSSSAGGPKRPAYAYFAIDSRGWNGQGTLSRGELYDRIHTAAVYGSYSLYYPNDPNLPQGQYDGQLIQTGCIRGLPLDNREQQRFIHNELTRKTRQLMLRYTGRDQWR
ncbi:uncharacterized protein LDX57_009156 [Aspergillus melleus]|uniref:uncharacterized protein n=1 Tax=Aspergillus melleus TaxID=138277 RepID=UPI001E8C9E3E|nr:uncharacterized protein LDX57_009156 [Aspergillus melleus]KAH8431493.1 hypothetical protein LDX57_009156 [Aspergillus melleus]